MPDTDNEEQQRNEERTEASSGRYYWVVLPRAGGTPRLVASQGGYEMRQLSDMLGGGAFSQIPVAELPKHKLAVCYKSVAATEGTKNAAASAWIGVTITGDCVVAQRRDTEAVHGGQRIGRRYVKPFLRSEAREVADAIQKNQK